ncbi:hypothetical protein K470DRAFT_258454 [Piedraia hortae CBS 480.64]|uniref:Uncharacterized protein n=1 Tax=Piedraia hortae CBS 480.64 TaxID=1314780 RepID=A0A6A7BXI7_9PEZI|nr:hypothetical protein K470DRAFT_258454 [Piedraia hortae CBS 480.64]
MLKPALGPDKSGCVRKKASKPSIFTPKKKTPPADAVRRPAIPKPRTEVEEKKTDEVNPEEWTSFEIFIDKSAASAGMRFHALKFQTTQKGKDGKPLVINPYDPSQFMRPVHLFRKLDQDKDGRDGSDTAAGEGEAKPSEQDLQRSANMAMIAPGGKPRKVGSKKNQSKNVEDIFYNDADPEKARKHKLRYEESRPWHMEDFNRTQKWASSYEEPMSKSSVLFEVSGGGFNIIPVEKWYKMTRQDRVQALSAERIEKIMQSKDKAPRWILKNQDEEADRRRRAIKRDSDDEDVRGMVEKADYRADVDELDFETKDEFQDDDEGQLFGETEEEFKDIERRLREEQRQANLAGTGIKDEDRDWDEEERKAQAEEEETRRRQRKLRRRLMKEEKREEYESDSDLGLDDSEFDSDSSLSDTSSKRNERGTSTKGANTPASRSEKKVTVKSLKRDADASELSGNEGSRKTKRSRLTGGEESPTASDVEPSRLGRPVKTAVGKTSLSASTRSTPKPSSRAHSPANSRGAPSPIATQSFPGKGTDTPMSPGNAQTLPTADEIRRAIPPGGLKIADVVAMFRSRFTSDRMSEFIALVRKTCKQDPQTKLIVRK